MKNILYYGNCQLGAIQKLIQNSNIKGRYIICHQTKINEKNFLKIIKKSNIIIMTLVSENYREKKFLSSKFILENARKNTKIIILPSFYFDYYYIDLKYIKNEKGEKIGTPIDYHHEFIIDSYKNNITIENVIKDYIENENLLSLKELEDKKNNSLNELKERELEGSKKYQNIRHYFFISSHDFILKNYKDKLLFYSMNHPTKYFFQYICKKILKLLNLPEKINMNIDPLSKTKCILYQCIQKGVSFSIKDNQPLIKEKRNIKDIINLYYSSYERINLK